jgi:hypothetical protein
LRGKRTSRLSNLERRQILQDGAHEKGVLFGKFKEWVLQKLVGAWSGQKRKASVEDPLARPEEERGTHLCFGSLFRQLSIISFIAFPYLYLPPSRSRVGGSSRIVLLRTLAGGKSEFGARPDASSRAVIPNDQMSAEGQDRSALEPSGVTETTRSPPLESYDRRSTTSGAIQQGVPTNDLRLMSPLGRAVIP